MSEQKRKIGRPNRFVYYTCFFALRLYFRLFIGTRFKFDRSGLKDLKSGPALIIAPHISGIDHITVGIACQKFTPTFVLSEHLFYRRDFRFIIKHFARAIPKKMFCADAGTVIGIMRAKNEGNVIIIFPEGRLNAVAHTYPVTPGTPQLVKRLKVPVYCVTGNGAGLVAPKWYKGFRKGLIEVKTSKVFSGEELSELSLDEISERIDKVIFHDDEKAMQGYRYPAKDTVKGLDGILYKCPECGKEFCLCAKKSRVSCLACGFETKLLDDYTFTDGKLRTVNEWFYWQIEMLDTDSVMEEDIDIGAVNEKGDMDLSAGRGHIRLDKERLTLTGSFFGEDIDYSSELTALGGTPYTPNKEFDIYYKKRLLYLQPKDRRSVVKWATFIDKAVAEKRGVQLYRFDQRESASKINKN